MRVDRKPVVHMFANAMVRFARLVRRIDVDDHQRQIIQTVKELMADLRRDCMRLRNRQLGIPRRSIRHAGGARANARALR